MKFNRHKPLDPAYIGDGVYASHDGYSIWISAEVDGRTHEIAMEPEVLRALDSYRNLISSRTPKEAMT